jgi:hypothetical protein
VIARRQIAEVLVRSLASDQALRKTFEIVARTGPEPDDFDALFAPLEADPPGALDGVHDTANIIGVRVRWLVACRVQMQAALRPRISWECSWRGCTRVVGRPARRWPSPRPSES